MTGHISSTWAGFAFVTIFQDSRDRVDGGRANGCAVIGSATKANVHAINPVRHVHARSACKHAA